VAISCRPDEPQQEMPLQDPRLGVVVEKPRRTNQVIDDESVHRERDDPERTPVFRRYRGGVGTLLAGQPGCRLVG
jgi:hypothetical protein